MATVCLTFDVDAEAGLAADSDAHRDRLSTVSEREFSVRRGLPRILELLAEHGLRATFYVAGATALRHAEAIRAIVDGGHEVGHHGHDHLASHTLDAARQAAEIDEGLEALRPFLGDAIGYHELESASRDDRPATLTFHPEIIGRGYRALALERLLKHLTSTGATVLTHGALAGRV